MRTTDAASGAGVPFALASLVKSHNAPLRLAVGHDSGGVVARDMRKNWSRCVDDADTIEVDNAGEEIHRPPGWGYGPGFTVMNGLGDKLIFRDPREQELGQPHGTSLVSLGARGSLRRVSACTIHRRIPVAARVLLAQVTRHPRGLWPSAAGQVAVNDRSSGCQ